MLAQQNPQRNSKVFVVQKLLLEQSPTKRDCPQLPLTGLESPLSFFSGEMQHPRLFEERGNYVVRCYGRN